MNVLFLGKTPSSIVDVLRTSGCKVIEQENQLSLDFFKEQRIDFAVSYRYRHIVKKPVIEYLNRKIINLHISVLPWNRGADPNLWSFLDDTPKGVTIHSIDEGLDTGDILLQKEIDYSLNDTLRSTYTRLSDTIEDLFRTHWPQIMSGGLKPTPQIGPGSFHRKTDRKPFEHLLENGWDTPVKKLIGRAKIAGI